MEAITTTSTLWDILENSKIVIPTFQRDYAQGRSGKEDLRKKFLKEIKEALSSGKKELLLDFVYGTKIDDTIYPLDGQQRLTTLWVLMWYATYYTSDEKAREERINRLKKFTYETRPSSKNFLEWLCDDLLRTENSNNSNQSLSDYIQSQNGFYSGWKQDPTVQSILRMLSGTTIKNKKDGKTKQLDDGIEQVFNDAPESLNRLFEETCPIKFYHLNLLGIKHPDNLYIKMNARGEQLTGFENFKADLVDFMSKNKEDELKEYVTLNNYKYILKKWDIDWTNLFWEIRGKSNSVDDLFFTFIKRFLLNQYIVNTDKVDKEDEISKLLYENEQKGYTSFELYEQLIKKENIVSLVKVLDNLKGIIIDLPLLSSQGYASFLPHYGDDRETVKSASFQERVLMYGICLYLQEEKSQNNFGRWLRVLVNLVYYNEISSFKEYESRIRFIKKVEESLGKNLGDVYSDEAISNLEKLAKEADTENYIQLKEEVEKIRIIGNNPQFEETLKNLESLWIFSGRIDCLLQKDLLEKEKLFEKLSELIGEEKRKYLCNSDNLIRFFQTILAKKAAENDKFPEGLKINDEHDNFRKILNNELKESLQVVLTEVLSENIPLDEIINKLDEIINKYEYSEGDWKYALIKDKSLWKYSYGKFGKHFADGYEVYLYKGTNRNPADIPLTAYSNFINKKYQENGKFPKNIEYQKDQEKWMVCYDNGECVEFRPYHESNSVII